MNFLAHAHVARQRPGGEEPAFVLGAVLPDLLAMAGLRLDRDTVPALVAEGWRSHHHADAAFHAHPMFLAGVGALRTDLRRTPLATGPRRAVAHAGWELLLDDAVTGDVATVTAFRVALELGPSLSDDAGWRLLLGRFRAIRPGPPPGVLTVAGRVHRAVSRRPRLAFAAEHVPAVAVVLDEHRHAILAGAPALLEELATG